MTVVQGTCAPRFGKLRGLLVGLVAVHGDDAEAQPLEHGELGEAGGAERRRHLAGLLGEQQQFLLANRGYATKTQIEAAGYSLPTEVVGKYTWDVAVSNTASPPTFTITFTAAGGQTADGNLTLDQQGTKGPAGKW